MASLPREVSLLPTPAWRDTKGQSASPARHQGSGVQLPDVALDPASWGKFEPAIRQWEAILGHPAPEPTEPGKHGKPRLNPALPEWMFGLPEGFVTQVPGLNRQDKLRILGNGVVPMQAAAALRFLIE